MYDVAMPEILKLTIETVWLFLPAIAANMTPVFAARFHWLPGLALPLDGYLMLRGRRLLGDHKTLRGLLTGLLFGSVVGLLQGSPAAGAALSLGALVGDTTKSFIKRQLDIAPGRPWIPFDQIDFVLGALLFGHWFVRPTIDHAITAVIVLGLGSYAVSALGISLRLKTSL